MNDVISIKSSIIANTIYGDFPLIRRNDPTPTVLRPFHKNHKKTIAYDMHPKTIDQLLT
jgi:hypothetical protein